MAGESPEIHLFGSRTGKEKLDAANTSCKRNSKNYQWRSVNWRQANKVVRQLRQRIFRATQEGKSKKVRS